jgi:MFS family permease
MLENPLAVMKRMPRPVRILIAGTFINKAGSFILPYLTLVLNREFHMTGGQAGALVMAYGVGSLVSIITGGVLTDALGRRRTLLLSLLGSGALAVAMAFSPSARVFVPLLVLFGFLADLYRPASSAIIGDLLPSEERASGFAALRVAVNLGFAVGMGLGGLLVAWSWRVLFAADGLTTAAFGLIVYASIAETRPALAQDTRVPAASSPWRDAVYLQMVVASLGFSILVFSFVTALPLTITVSAGYPAWAYGALSGANGLLIAAFEVSVVAALQRYRRLKVAAVGMLLAGVGFGLTGFVMHWSWFLFTVVLWTLGEILTVPQQMAFIADWAPAEARGRYLGLYGATWSLGMALNPILILPLHARLPEVVFWPLTILLVAPAALVLRRLDREADRPERLRGRAGGIVSVSFPALSPEP